MAIDVLKHKMHERKHDLESIYWLLIWIILRHVNHNQGEEACGKLFDVDDRELAASQKRTWLVTSDLRVNDNEPLTELLELLRRLFRKQLGDKDTPSVEVTYDTLLAAIDDALRLPGWPENDSSIPFKPCSGSKSVKDASQASSGKRKAESRAASMSSKRQKASTSLSSLSVAEYDGDVEQVSLNSFVTALLLIKVFVSVDNRVIGIHSTILMVTRFNIILTQCDTVLLGLSAMYQKVASPFPSLTTVLAT